MIDIFVYITLFILLFFSAFFSASETAFSSMNLLRIKSYKDQGRRGAKNAVILAENFETLLSTILVCNNFVNILQTAIATTYFTYKFGAFGVVVSTVIMTILILMFGEITPKNFAKKHPEKTACFVSGVLVLNKRLLGPIVQLLVIFNKSVSKMIKIENNDPSLTESELISIVESIEDEGVLEEEECELIKSAINFDDITIEDLYTPRTDIIAVSLDSTKERVLKIVVDESVSRMPVYNENLDNIVGILYEKDYFREVVADKRKFKVSNIMKEPTMVSKNINALALLNIFKENKEHIAIVVDENGGTDGIITMEDLLESLVGEIWDEYDNVPNFVTKLGNSKWLVTTDCSIEELFEDHLEIQSMPNFNKVSQWLYSLFGELPEVEDDIHYENLIIKVNKMKKNHIENIIIEKK